MENLNHFITRFITEAVDKNGNLYKAKIIFEIVLNIQQSINEISGHITS